MTDLRTDTNLADPDAFYAALVAMHEGLTAEQSRLANSALILLLANHVGDAAVLKQALAHARAVGLDVAPDVGGG